MGKDDPERLVIFNDETSSAALGVAGATPAHQVLPLLTILNVLEAHVGNFPVSIFSFRHD